ncbi:hypothetical protein P691DRAFT_790607, partial [Macrolepiota fuliginosa MF-IS2]
KDGFNNETNSDAQDTLIKHIFKVAKVFNLVTIITPPMPSPPPPCPRPHSDKEDIHMEPPTPACVFSETATQTPAPLPEEATPPPVIMSTKPKPMVAPIKSGPPSRPSFAKAVAKTLCPNAPPLCQFFIETPVTTGISLPELIQQANNSLSHASSPLHINSACFTNSGITCATASVPTQLDLNIIEAMLPAKITGSWATLPSSQSFIKIIDIPYFKPSTMELPNGQEIGNQLIPSPILVDMIKHVQFVHNSPKADSGTFWIDLVDSQQGTLASSLIGC